MLAYLDVQSTASQHGESGSGSDKPCCDWTVGICGDWRNKRIDDCATQDADFSAVSAISVWCRKTFSNSAAQPSTLSFLRSWSPAPLHRVRTGVVPGRNPKAAGAIGKRLADCIIGAVRLENLDLGFQLGSDAHHDMRSAEDSAAQIFGAAGIRSRWLELKDPVPRAQARSADPWRPTDIAAKICTQP